MTPIGIRYEDAYAKAFPFDRLIEEMIQPGMIAQTAQLMWEAVRGEVEINIIINNRAAGNVPRLAQRIVSEFVAMGSKLEDPLTAETAHSPVKERTQFQI
jgi:hypothetical protein